jgi:hypothetical protein
MLVNSYTFHVGSRDGGEYYPDRIMVLYTDREAAKRFIKILTAQLARGNDEFSFHFLGKIEKEHEDGHIPPVSY